MTNFARCIPGHAHTTLMNAGLKIKTTTNLKIEAAAVTAGKAAIEVCKVDHQVQTTVLAATRHVPQVLTGLTSL